uniref:Transmembrane protein 273 n=2 Tax=Capra hircus TaxID=9925 RepID=A0A8C2S619_CAPHI
MPSLWTSDLWPPALAGMTGLRGTEQCWAVAAASFPICHVGLGSRSPELWSHSPLLCPVRSPEQNASMLSAARTLTVLLLLLDVGAAQVLATGKPARAETDIKYAIIGTAVGIAISAGFLALKFCLVRKHMFDDDSSDLRSANAGFSETIALKKRTARLNLNFSERNAHVIEL